MPGLPVDPLPTIAIPSSNPDLPPAQFPALSRINVIDLVGPSAANRQHRSLEKRTTSLAQLINDLVTNSNDVDVSYLRRDGSTQKNATAGITGNMPVNGNKFTGVGVGTDPTDSINMSQLTAEAAARSAGDAFLQSQLDEVSPLRFSPYSVLVFPTPPPVVPDQGSVGSILTGGIIVGNDIDLSGGAQTPAQDLHAYSKTTLDCAVVINAPTRVIELVADGNITITANITCRDLRIVSRGGSITIASGVTINTDQVAGGVVTLRAATTITAQCNVNTTFAFVYADGDIVLTGGTTWRAIDTQVPLTVENSEDVFDVASSFRWGRFKTAGNGPYPLHGRYPHGFYPFGLSNLYNPLSSEIAQGSGPDYLAPYAGVLGMSVGFGSGSGSGGSGPAGTGFGGALSGSNPCPYAGVPDPWKFPAAPGGASGVNLNSGYGGGAATCGRAGGAIVVNSRLGSLTLTGATLNASGGNGGTRSGGGGGGSVKVSGRTGVTGGTLQAAGGSGGAHSPRAGGGGLVAAISGGAAPTPAATTAALGGGTATGATAGVVATLTVTSAQFDAFFVMGYLGR